MLVRLEHALDCPDLAKHMMLVPKAVGSHPTEQINLVVAYNGSARSQTALDLTLWIAHQTRLVTRRSVTVQVVYVVDNASDRAVCADPLPRYLAPIDDIPEFPNHTMFDFCDRPEVMEVVGRQVQPRSYSTAVVADGAWEFSFSQATPYAAAADPIHQFEKADRILWQARNLADEWRGSLETHLRFGNLVEELRIVACQVSTTALILGCSSPFDPIVQALGHDLPFPILGIPAQIPAD